MAKGPKLVDHLDENETYTTTISFRSIGGSPQVVPDIDYSHTFVDKYDGDYPASYLLTRQILMMLNVMNSMQQIANEEEDDEPFLSVDELSIAAQDADDDESSGDETVH